MTAQTVTYGKTTEATKHIRKDLKQVFPGVKFSVRKDGSAWYDTVLVSYDDQAVSSKYVHAIVEKYRGYRFNGMTDNIDPVEPVDVDGTLYHFPIVGFRVSNKAEDRW